MKYLFRNFKCLTLTFFWVFASFGQTPVTAAELQLNLPEAQAHFTVEIVKQIQWPNESDLEQFNVGILGKDPNLERAFQSKTNTIVRGKNFHFEEFNEARFKEGFYAIVFITNSRRSRNEAVFQEDNNVLVIVDGRVNKKEMMLSLITDGDRIKLRFNRANITQRGFIMSANLLDFAGTREDLSEELKIRESRLNKLLQQVKGKEKELQQLNEKLLQANEKIKITNQTLKRYESQSVVLKDRIDKSNNEIQNNEQDIQEQKKVIADIQDEMQSKSTQVDRLEDRILLNKAVLTQQTEKINQQNNLLLNKDETIDEQRDWLRTNIFIFIGFSILMIILLKTNSLRRKANKKLKTVNTKLFELATTDDLTGLFSRRHFLESTQKELLRDQRNHFDSVFLMIDIDFFKEVNDTYGHPMGDEVIRQVANLLSESMRQYDIVGRLGGEEYAMMLMDCDVHKATDIAERLCQRVSQQVIILDASEVSVTISIGASQILPEDDSIEQAMVRADKALYQAKNDGRNRVVVFTPEQPAD